MDSDGPEICEEEDSNDLLYMYRVRDIVKTYRSLHTDSMMGNITRQLNDYGIDSPTTLSPPSTTSPGTEKGVSTIMWIHLQPRICTEWEGVHQGKIPSFQKDDLCCVNEPVTFHRCILKSSSSSWQENSKELECHVCNTSYRNSLHQVKVRPS